MCSNTCLTPSLSSGINGVIGVIGLLGERKRRGLRRRSLDISSGKREGTEVIGINIRTGPHTYTLRGRLRAPKTAWCPACCLEAIHKRLTDRRSDRLGLVGRASCFCVECAIALVRPRCTTEGGLHTSLGVLQGPNIRPFSRSSG